MLYFALLSLAACPKTTDLPAAPAAPAMAILPANPGPVHHLFCDVGQEGLSVRWTRDGLATVFQSPTVRHDATASGETWTCHVTDPAAPPEQPAWTISTEIVDRRVAPVECPRGDQSAAAVAPTAREIAVGDWSLTALECPTQLGDPTVIYVGLEAETLPEPAPVEETEAAAEAGDGDAEAGEADAEAGDGDAEAGEAAAEAGDGDAEVGEADAEAGDGEAGDGDAEDGASTGENADADAGAPAGEGEAAENTAASSPEPIRHFFGRYSPVGSSRQTTLTAIAAPSPDAPTRPATDDEEAPGTWGFFALSSDAGTCFRGCTDRHQLFAVSPLGQVLKLADIERLFGRR